MHTPAIGPTTYIFSDQGASCVVKAVEHKRTGFRYALKVLTKTTANEHLFKQEAKILGTEMICNACVTAVMQVCSSMTTS